MLYKKCTAQELCFFLQKRAVFKGLIINIINFQATKLKIRDKPKHMCCSHIPKNSKVFERFPLKILTKGLKITSILLYTHNHCKLKFIPGSTQADFDLHMTCHFEHVCPHCDYKSRTEGRLKRHIKDFHTEDGEFGNRTMPGRPKVFKCKQCDYSTTEKVC